MTTKITVARKKANQKWDKENMTTIAARVKKDKAEKYKAYAASQGKSINALIIDLLEQIVSQNDQ